MIIYLLNNKSFVIKVFLFTKLVYENKRIIHNMICNKRRLLVGRIMLVNGHAPMPNGS